MNYANSRKLAKVGGGEQGSVYHSSDVELRLRLYPLPGHSLADHFDIATDGGETLETMRFVIFRG
jgi:hypothetical protein